jgi:membrane fusion protein (multidrug efflux system)
LTDSISQPTPAAAPPRWRKPLLAVLVLAVAAVAISYRLATRGTAATDDAQIEGNLVPITARVSGYVAAIAVDENQLVRPGQLLVQLDSRDLKAKVERAEADLANQQALASAAAGQVSLVERTAPAGELQAGARLTAAGAGIAAAQSQIAVAEAQLKAADAGVQAARSGLATANSEVEVAAAQVQSAQAGLQAADADVRSSEAQAKKAAADAARLRELYAGGAISKQQCDAAEAANTSADAAWQASKQRVESARAAVDQARAGQTGAEAGLEQAKARLASANAAAEQARVGVRLAQTAVAQAEAASAEARAGRSAAETTPQQIGISQAQREAAAARIQQSAADLHNARLQLSYTQITAPLSGIVSKKSVQLGQYVQPGQLLMAVVPLKDVWVVANFKETQVGHMRPGQRATIEVDSYPGQKLAARIDSIGAATGARFSILPPENATGNYVKVVQRIPVKLVFDHDIPGDIVLRLGQNVTAKVYLSGGRG